MSQKIYYRKEVENILEPMEISKSRLNNWMLRGVFKPEKPARGSGFKVEYTRSDIYHLALIHSLSASGIRLEHIRLMILKLQEEIPIDLIAETGDPAINLKWITVDIENPDKIKFASTKAKTPEVLKGSEKVLTLNYEMLRKRVDKLIAKHL